MLTFTVRLHSHSRLRAKEIHLFVHRWPTFSEQSERPNAVSHPSKGLIGNTSICGTKLDITWLFPKCLWSERSGYILYENYNYEITKEVWASEAHHITIPPLVVMTTYPNGLIVFCGVLCRQHSTKKHRYQLSFLFLSFLFLVMIL